MRRFALVGLLCFALPLAAQKSKPKATATPAAAAVQAETGAWVGSSKGKTYYKAGCRGAEKLAAKNRIYFKSEEDAKKAGYTHSRQRGC